MPSDLLALRPPRLLSADQLARIHEAAVRVVTAQGLRVRHGAAREAAARAGLRVDGERVFPDRQQVEELAAGRGAARPPDGSGGEPCGSAGLPEDPSTALRAGGAPTEAGIGGPDSAGFGDPAPQLQLYVPKYCEFVHDLDRDEIVPLTTERLIEATKLVDTMAARNVYGSAPGIPTDVPPPLQRLAQCRIGAQYSRHGRTPNVEELSPRAFPYLLDMAEALGSPYRYHVVYVVSPLTLSGESCEGVAAILSRLESIHVSNMLSVGGTAPIRLADALALAAAEAMGASLVMAAFSRLPVDWSVRVCPFDPRTMALSLGGPEEVLFQRASDEVTAWYQGREPGSPSGMLHSRAKLPDAQAAAERMCLLLFGALGGTRHFSGAGALSLDEVFSAEQLVVDCEMRDHVQRLLQGADTDCDPAAAAAEIAAGLEQGFLGLESTASAYRQVYWLPTLFLRDSFASWKAAGASRLGERAREMVRECLRRHDYELAPEIRRELDRIYARAERDLLG